MLEVLDPGHGRGARRDPGRRRGRRDAAVRAARAAQPRLGAHRARPSAARASRPPRGACATTPTSSPSCRPREGGKPLADSRGGVEAGIGAIEQYAELGPLHRGRALQGGWDATDLMVHEPRGVVALLVPWNDPVAIACGQLAAALVTGNAVVFKPSEKTPLSGAPPRRAARPPGDVLQLLLGDARAGRPLAAHPGVDLVIHTGSVATGPRGGARPARAGCARRCSSSAARTR